MNIKLYAKHVLKYGLLSFVPFPILIIVELLLFCLAKKLKVLQYKALIPCKCQN